MIITANALFVATFLLGAPQLFDEIKPSAGNMDSARELLTKNEAIDPIITGQTKSPQTKKDWERRQKEQRDCGRCTDQNPFPGDLD